MVTGYGRTGRTESREGSGAGVWAADADGEAINRVEKARLTTVAIRESVAVSLII